MLDYIKFTGTFKEFLHHSALLASLDVEISAMALVTMKSRPVPFVFIIHIIFFYGGRPGRWKRPMKIVKLI